MQREQRKVILEIEQREQQFRITTSDIDDYCDTICKLYQCQNGYQDKKDVNLCVCIQDGKKCNL